MAGGRRTDRRQLVGARPDPDSRSTVVAHRIAVGRVVVELDACQRWQFKVTASALSGVPRGTASGWGKSYGAGAGFDFTPQHGIVVEWARHNFDTPRDGGVRVDLTSVGYLFRF